MTNQQFTRTVGDMETFAKCPALRVCGHCPLMEHPYRKQLEMLNKHLYTVFSPYTPFVEPIIGMEQMEGFLSAVQVDFGRDWSGSFKTGLLSANQGQFLAIKACMLRNPILERMITSIRKLATRVGIASSFPASKLSLRISRNEEEVLLCFTLMRAIDSSFSSFLHTIRREHPKVIGITVCDASGEPTLFWGRPYLQETLCSLQFHLPPTSDFPPCPSQTEVLYERVMNLAPVKEGQAVIDLTTMHGIFALLAAKAGAGKVLLLQEHTPFTNEAALNGEEHILRMVGDNEKHLRHLAKRREYWDLLFLSPDETGATRSILDSVLVIKPKRIVYLSRSVRTLERDIQYLLQDQFYRLKTIQGVDMHPHREDLHVIAVLENTLIIRPFQEREFLLLEHYLYEAIFVPEGEEPPPRSVLEDPSLKHYYQDFGKVGDYALLGELHGEIVGAVWTRLFLPDEQGYGYIDAETPEICISVDAGHRNKGIGRRLMEEMCNILEESGYEYVSLSVQKENPAHHLYSRVGFSVIGERGDALLMVKRLHAKKNP